MLILVWLGKKWGRGWFPLNTNPPNILNTLPQNHPLIRLNNTPIPLLSSSRPAWAGGMRRGICALGVVVIGCLCHLLLNPSLFPVALPKPHEDQSCKDRILHPHRRKGQYKQEDRDKDQEWQVLDSHVRAFNRTLTDDTITTRQHLLDAHSRP